MVKMRTNYNVFVPKMLVLSWKDCNNVMGGHLLVLLCISKVVIEPFCLLFLDNRFEFQATEFVDNEL